jgi:hypothetical protein
MLPTAAALLLFSASATAEPCAGHPISRREPLSRSVELVLTTDRQEYVVGAPVRLIIEAKNVGLQSAVIYDVAGCRTTIQYRRGKERLLTYEQPRSAAVAQPVGTVVAWPLTIAPGNRERASRTIVFDGSTRAFVLQRPGTYEFNVLYDDSSVLRGAADQTPYLVDSGEGPPKHDRLKKAVSDHSWQHGAVRSNTATVVVRRPDATDSEASKVYLVEHIGRLLDPGTSVGAASDQAIEAAADFVERYSESVYAAHVRTALEGHVNARLGAMTGEQLRAEKAHKLRRIHELLRKRARTDQ